jgi:hypothetical protein
VGRSARGRVGWVVGKGRWAKRMGKWAVRNCFSGPRGRPRVRIETRPEPDSFRGPEPAAPRGKFQTRPRPRQV